MHYLYMLTSMAGEIFIIPSTDKFPQNVANIRINEALKRNQTKTGGLLQTQQLKVNARVVPTASIYIEYRLINGQLGTVMQIITNSNRNATKI